MTDPPPKKIAANEDGWPIYDLWVKYEDIAMHFNDLLIRLRTQALAAIAALTTIIGIFAKTGDTASTWQIIAFAFGILILFWVSIWVLDFCYYNPLLIGAVEALFTLEAESKDKLRIHYIEMSTKIRDAVAGHLPEEAKAWKLVRGRWLFYTLVFAALVGGLAYSIIQYCKHAAT